VGYRGKVVEQERARALRARSWTLAEIAQELGVARLSVSVWVRDVVFEPRPRQRPRFRSPSSLHLAKLAEIDAMNRWGAKEIGTLTEAAFLAAGTALYAGEGAKADHAVNFANTDVAMIAFFCDWLRCFFDIDESRLRVRVYLHEGLDIDAAEGHWSAVAQVPRSQFTKSYRPPADPSRRLTKHEFGCAYVIYSCAATHRGIMGLHRALLSSDARSGVAQLVAQRPVKPTVESSSLSPGAPTRR
jgi:transcriptional regulator with XRE-family HTH domain